MFLQNVVSCVPVVGVCLIDLVYLVPQNVVSCVPVVGVCLIDLVHLVPQNVVNILLNVVGVCLYIN